jgi:hypothetical protein
MFEEQRCVSCALHVLPVHLNVILLLLLLQPLCAV